MILAVSFAAIFFALPSFFIGAKENSLSKYLPDQKVNLGLDLQGGSQLTLEVDFDYYIKEQLANLRDEIRSSFRDESVRAIPELVGGKIIFTLADEEQIKAAKKLIRKLNGNVEISESSGQFQVYFTDAEMSQISQNLIKQSIEIIRRRIDENGTKEPTIQAQGNNRILLQVPGVQNSSELKSRLGKTAKMTFHFLAESAADGEIMALYDAQGRQYPVKSEVVLSGDLLINANPTYHEGLPAVAFRFNAQGSKKFADITRDNVGKILAIVLDGRVVTAPRINGIINQGSGVISGSFTAVEAGEVALLLRAGALPTPLKIIEERTVGPSLGLDSIESGKISILVAVLMIGFCMVLFYGTFGMVANVAMLVNLAIIIAGLSMIGATLTLPGIAGIVLTMGMSVDANVLIFERIKEELREKKTILASVERGFDQAFRTIIDSNLTTLIVAFFLYMFGNGPVKGFAVTLSIGILSSMFTAILLSRMIIAVWLKKSRPKKLNLI